MNYQQNSMNRLPRAHNYICAGLKVQVPKAKWERDGLAQVLQQICFQRHKAAYFRPYLSSPFKRIGPLEQLFVLSLHDSLGKASFGKHFQDLLKVQCFNSQFLKVAECRSIAPVTPTSTLLWQTDSECLWVMLFSWCSWNPGPRPPAAQQAGAVVQWEWPQRHLRRGKPAAGIHPAPQPLPGTRTSAPTDFYLTLLKCFQSL